MEYAKERYKPMTIDISGQPCRDNEMIANEFAQYIPKNIRIQSPEFEPQVSEVSCSHHRSFKFVSHTDGLNKVSHINLRMLPHYT